MSRHGIFKFSLGFILAISPLLSSCASKAVPSNQIVLEVSPFSVQPIRQGSFADAIPAAADLTALKSIVVFRIEKIAQGSLAKIKVAPLSKVDQMKDALKNKDYKTVLLSDYDSQVIEVERQRFRVAVNNPRATFGFDELDLPAGALFKLKLSHFKKEEDTYILESVERIQ